MTLTLRSPAFDDGERIPDRHARNHGNVSPPLDLRWLRHAFGEHAVNQRPMFQAAKHGRRMRHSQAKS